MTSPVRTADRVGRLVRAGLDHLSFQHEVDAVLRASVGYDLAAWATIDPATLLVTSCMPLGDDPFGPDHERRTFELEYLDEEPLTLGRFSARHPIGTLRSTFADPRESRRYRELLAPAGVIDELNAAFVVDGHCWGAVRAYRHGADAVPFTPDDAEHFAAVAPAIAEGLRTAFLHAATADDAAIDDPPGLVTLDERGRIASCTSQALAWLDTLPAEGDTPVVLSSLAGRVASGDEASVVVIGTRGPLALHASRLKGSDAQVAVILERPRPIELTPHILVAYDLTPRESQVTELVLRGRTTAQIARALGVSAYTVQDHLKSVFAKVGVQTRGELANAVYVRFYLPPRLEGAVPGPYGYFLGR